MTGNPLMTFLTTRLDFEGGVTYRSFMATLWKHPNGTFYVKHENKRFSLKTKDEPTANRKFIKWKRNQEKALREQEERGLFSVGLFRFIDEFLEYTEVNYPPGTHNSYYYSLQKLKSCWGDIPVRDVTDRHLETFITDLRRAKLKPPTINKDCRHVKVALRKAVKWKYLRPGLEFPKPLKEQRELRYFTKPELKALFKAIKDTEFYDMCLLSVYSGLRSGELARLAWADIDNPEGFLRVTPEQKNKEEGRIPINTTMRRVLDRQKGGDSNSRIFRFSTNNWISQKFKGYAVEAGLPKHRFHDLRHTFGSHLAMQGYPPKTIMELMRHKSLASTMVYLTLSPEHLKEASEGLSLEFDDDEKKDEKK